MVGCKSLMSYTRVGETEVRNGRVFHTQLIGKSVYGRLPHDWEDANFIVVAGLETPDTVVLRKVDISVKV